MELNEMKVESTILEHSNFFIKLRGNYGEEFRLVKQTGGPGLVAIFTIELSPDNSNYITVCSKSDLDKRYLEAVISGLKQIMKELSLDEIALAGFRITFDNHQFHPIDSNPIGYKVGINLFMKNLLSNNFVIQKRIKAPLSVGRRFVLTKIQNGIPYRNTEYQSIQTQYIPNNFLKTIKINSIISISNTENYESEYEIEYQIEPLRSMNTGYNHITIICKKGSLSMISMGNYLNVVNNLIQEFGRLEVNIKGFQIYVIAKQELPYLDYRISENEHQRFEWILRNIFYHNEFVSVEESGV